METITTDGFGNGYKVDYSFDEKLPTRVHYFSGSGDDYTNHYNLDFQYRKIPSTVKYAYGKKLVKEHVLSRIRVVNFNDKIDFNLTYDSENYLEKIQKCIISSGISLNCLQPTIFKYDGKKEIDFNKKMALTTYVGNNSKDAKLDIYRLRTADINGDGKTDIYTINGWGSNETSSMHLSKEGGIFSSAIRGPAHYAGDNVEAARFDLSRVHLVDFNGDGLSDVFIINGWGSAPSSTLYLSKGDGSFEAAANGPKLYVGNSIEGGSADIARVKFGDFNGDGYLDIYQVIGWGSTEKDNLYLNNTKQKVINNIVEKDKNIFIRHENLNERDDFYQSSKAIYPLVTLNKGDFVSSVSINNFKFSYRYKNFIYDIKRRNSLGFKEVVIKDDSRNSETKTVYNQDYPFIGMPVSTETRINNILVSKSVHQNKYKGILNQTPLFIYSDKSTSWTYDYDNPNRLLTKTVTLNSTYDEFGNPLNIKQEYYGSSNNWLKTIETNNQYKNNENLWHLGRLTNAKATHRSNDGKSITKESSFKYHPTTGLLIEETVEPNKPEYTLKTQYTHDEFGNRTQSTVRGDYKTFNVDGTLKKRTPFVHMNKIEYSAGSNHPKGLFPTKFTNAKGHTETLTYDGFKGTVLSKTNANGVTTRFEYDLLGRKVKTIPAVGKPSITKYEWCTHNQDCPDSQGYLIRKRVDGLQGYSASYFDRHGKEVRTASADRKGQMIYVEKQYDALDRLIKVSEPSYSKNDWAKFTLTEYDALDRVVKITRPDGVTEEVTYNGFITTTKDVKGRIRSKEANALGQSVRVTDPLQGTVDYEYDVSGNVTKTKTCGSGLGCTEINMTYNLVGKKINMTDPDMGTWHYRYNSLGEIVWKKDAKGQTTETTYDSLGRMTSRKHKEGTSFWYYDTARYGKGKLHKAVGVNGDVKELAYDSYGRNILTKAQLDGTNFYTRTAYNNEFNRLDSLTYPTGFKLKYNYQSAGALDSVTKFGDNNTQYWSAGELCKNKPGLLCAEYLGTRNGAGYFAGIKVSQSYDDLNPWIVAQDARIHGGEHLQAFGYEYDETGNLTARSELGGLMGAVEQKREIFTYDTLDRVTSATLNGTRTGNYQYDSLGNIKHKNDVGAYIYGQPSNVCSTNWAGPHAVTQTVLNGKTTNYCYDQNGNLIKGDGRTVIWNGFNKPTKITQNNGKWAEFYYGANKRRYKKISSDGTTTYYVGMGVTGNLLYEREKKGDTIINKNHIYVGGKRIAVKMEDSKFSINKKEIIHYYLKDNLGSVTAIIDQDGKVVHRKSYDVWGKERNASTWKGQSEYDESNHRGYTGHESIQEMGLVHMNGRVYDPILARFMSTDPYIQAAINTQSYNRYTYVDNNPLANVDPSGYFFKRIAKELKRAGSRIDRQVRRSGGWGWVAGAIINPATTLGFAKHRAAVKNIPYYAQLSTIVAGTLCGPGCSGAVTAMNVRIMGARTQDALRSSAITFLSGRAFNALHDVGDGIHKLLAHGAVGGVTSMAQGGEFKDGFLGSAVSYGFSWSGGYKRLGLDNPKGLTAYAKNAVVASVVGGTASWAGGGKFANGAVSGAFSRLFNDLHGQDPHTVDEEAKEGRTWANRLRSVTSIIKKGLGLNATTTVGNATTKITGTATGAGIQALNPETAKGWASVGDGEDQIWDVNIQGMTAEEMLEARNRLPGAIGRNSE